VHWKKKSNHALQITTKTLSRPCPLEIFPKFIRIFTVPEHTLKYTYTLTQISHLIDGGMLFSILFESYLEAFGVYIHLKIILRIKNKLM
jgi:hypothetical protein